MKTRRLTSQKRLHRLMRTMSSASMMGALGCAVGCDSTTQTSSPLLPVDASVAAPASIGRVDALDAGAGTTTLEDAGALKDAGASTRVETPASLETRSGTHEAGADASANIAPDERFDGGQSGNARSDTSWSPGTGNWRDASSSTEETVDDSSAPNESGATSVYTSATEQTIAYATSVSAGTSDSTFEPDGGLDSGDETIDDGPTGQSSEMYAFSATTRLLAEYNSYVLLASNLHSDPSLDRALIHIPSGVSPLVFGEPRSGRFYVSVSTGATRAVDRYELDPSSIPVVTGTLSLDRVSAEYGSSFQLVSDEVALLMQPTELLVWNPTQMTLVDRFSIDTEAEGGAARTSATPIRIGTELFVGLGWVGSSGTVLDVSGMLIIDAQTLQTTVIRDERCPYARDGVLGDDGFIYLGTEAYSTTVHALNGTSAAPPCVVRFDPKTRTYDPSFQLTSAQPLAGAPSSLLLGSFVASPSGNLFVRLLDSSLIEGDVYKGSGPRVLSSAGSVFRWARVDQGETLGFSWLETEPTHGSVVPVKLGNRLFVPRFQWGPTDPDVPGANHWPMHTEYVELRDDGPSEPLFTVPGQSFSGVRIQ